MTEYRDLPGFCGYQVGSDGSVWSLFRNHKLAEQECRGCWYRMQCGMRDNGYLQVTVGWRSWQVHQLVILAFKGPAPEGMINPTVAHENGVRLDNRPGNLTWKTQKDNMADKVRHGTAQVGERHGMALMTEREVLAMRAMRSQGYSCRQIAEAFGRNRATVKDAVSGRRWGHI